MSADLPQVSIVTPSFNQGAFLEHTIKSVKEQDYPRIEHIIVDGGSTDSTLDVLRRNAGTYKMKWVSEADEGQANAINKGFRAASGRIIGWLNSDDVYFRNDTIARMVEAFRALPSAHVIYGNDVLIDESGQFLLLRRSRRFRLAAMLRDNLISQPATFFRREVVERHPLDETLHYVMDYEFWLRLHRQGLKLQHIETVIAGNRIHSQRKMVTGRRKALEELDRVRGPFRSRGRLLGETLVRIDRLSALSRRLVGLWMLYDVWRRKEDTVLRSDPAGLAELFQNQVWCTRLRKAQATWSEQARSELPASE